MPDFVKRISKFFYSVKKFSSSQNGEIIVKKTFFTYEIVSGHCFQSSAYINHLWRKILKRVPKKFKPKKVLLLGLGGGGAVREILKRFKNCQISAVEYDPVMVEIAKDTFLEKINQARLQIFIENAADFIKKNPQKKFDLILIDLFKGTNSSSVLKSAEFMAGLKDKMQPAGYILINFYKEKKELADKFDQFFSNCGFVTYWFNQMAVYRNFGLGNIKDPLPAGFINKEQSAIYLATEINKPATEKVINNQGVLGIARDRAFYILEKYRSSAEPLISQNNKFKIVFWEPVGPVKYSKKWLAIPWLGEIKKLGIVTLENEDYWQNWSNHALRHRHKWLQNNLYDTVETDIKTFTTAYFNSKSADIILRRGFCRVLRYHLARHKDDVHLFIVRQRDNQQIIAGLGIINYADISQSTHIISFISRHGKKTSVGVGLIDHWYKYCLANKIKFLNFGRVWKKGDPHDWQGFSNFKKQFNVYQIYYKKVLIRFVSKKNS